MDVENRLLASLKYSSINFGVATSAWAPMTKALLSVGFGFDISASGKETKADLISAMVNWVGRFSFNASPVGRKQDKGAPFPRFALGVQLPAAAERGMKGTC
jgi:hypothetical protein